ncbi:hypothetical protein WN48_09021 [Eufriesea mexicana]|nr:hypothetical protein WN48_09021 [Eufriesea mexicana]
MIKFYPVWLGWEVSVLAGKRPAGPRVDTRSFTGSGTNLGPRGSKLYKNYPTDITEYNFVQSLLRPTNSFENTSTVSFLLQTTRPVYAIINGLTKCYTRKHIVWNDLDEDNNRCNRDVNRDAETISSCHDPRDSPSLFTTPSSTLIAVLSSPVVAIIEAKYRDISQTQRQLRPQGLRASFADTKANLQELENERRSCDSFSTRRLFDIGIDRYRTNVELGRLDWSSAEEATDTRRQGDGEGTCPVKQQGMRLWGTIRLAYEENKGVSQKQRA